MEVWEQANLVFLLLFILFKPPKDLMMPTHRHERNVLSLLIQMIISSKNTLTDTPKITFCQLSGHPWAIWAHAIWHTEFTITGDFPYWYWCYPCLQSHLKKMSLLLQMVLFHSFLWLNKWLLCPWNSPGKNTRMGRYSLLQGIFPTQGSHLGLLHQRQILHHLS